MRRKGLFLFPFTIRIHFQMSLKKFLVCRFSGWETAPEDVPTTHSIHNLVNEQCWKRILEWEQLHSEFVSFMPSHSHNPLSMWLVSSFLYSECSYPKLESFHGRPKDFSPRARLKHFFGWALVHWRRIERNENAWET
jgi:cytochrome c heme-lyase